MDKKFFADKILKLVMYSDGIKKELKMTAFAAIDFLFQGSFIGLIITVLMFLLKELSLQNARYTLIVSLVAGAISAYFDMTKVKNGRLTLEPKADSDTRDYCIIFGVIIIYIAAISYVFVKLV